MGGDKLLKADNKFIRKINRFSFHFLEGKINFHTRHNAAYEDNEILKPLIYLFIRNRYPEYGSKRYGEITRKRTPDADTIYRRLKKKNKHEIMKEFLDIQSEIINEIKRREKANRITILIDEHEIPWFGESNPYVVGTNNFNGTKLAFKYMTINAIIGSYRICLSAIPVTPFSHKARMVDKLLEIAEKWFGIGVVLFDRGFSKDSKVLNTVEKRGLKYVAPMEKSQRIKEIANTGDGVNPFYHTNYEFGKGKAKTNLFFIPNEKYEKEKWKNYHVFCTNIDVTRANISFLADLYSKRWNIENFYRDLEKNFMIKTKTEDFILRYFFFLFASLLYNLWYFVRGFSQITAERWKDMIEDELREYDVIEFKLMLEKIIQLKQFYLSLFFGYGSIFSHCFLREAKFATIQRV